MRVEAVLSRAGSRPQGLTPRPSRGRCLSPPFARSSSPATPLSARRIAGEVEQQHQQTHGGHDGHEPGRTKELGPPHPHETDTYEERVVETAAHSTIHHQAQRAAQQPDGEVVAVQEVRQTAR